jgi:hypothetical protein
MGNVGSAVAGYNAMSDEWIFCFRGSDGIVDAIKDINIVMANSIPYSVFQADLDYCIQTIMGILDINVNGTGGQHFVASTRIRFTSHSYGSPLAMGVIWHLAKIGALQLFTTPPEIVNFNPLIYPTDITLEMIDFIQRGIDGEAGYTQYASIPNLITNHIVRGDAVSSLYPFYGIGNTKTRPPKPGVGLLGSLSYYTNIDMINTQENHYMDNWITPSVYNKRPAPIVELPYPVSTYGGALQLNGATLVIENRRMVDFDGNKQQKLALEGQLDGGVSKEVVNMFASSALNKDKYYWTFELQPYYEVEDVETDPNDSSVKTRFLTPLYKITNQLTNHELYVMFRHDKEIDSSAHSHYLINYFTITTDAQGLTQYTDTDKLLRVVSGITGSQVATNNGYPTTEVNKSTYSGLGVQTRLLYEWTIILSSEVQPLATVEIVGHDETRRFFHDDLHEYVPPFTYMLFSNHQTTDTHGRTHIMGGLPTTTHFAIESVEYPGYFLQYTADPSPLGGSNGVTQDFNYSYTGGGTNYTDLYYNTQFTFTQPSDTTNWDTKYKFNRWGSADYSGIRHINSAYANGLNEDWHGAQYHAFYNVDGTDNEWVIDTEMNASWANSTHPGIGLAMAHSLNNTIYLGYPYRYEYDYVDQTTGSWKASSSTLTCLRFRLVQV